MVVAALAWPASDADDKRSQELQCSAVGGCTLVPNYLIDQTIEKNRALIRRVIELTYNRNCAT